MFNLKANDIVPTQLDVMIDGVSAHLEGLTPDSTEYSNAVDQYIKLHKLRDESNARKRVSPDVLAQLAGSLGGILAIITFEKSGHVIITKALGFVMKAAR